MGHRSLQRACRCITYAVSVLITSESVPTSSIHCACRAQCTMHILPLTPTSATRGKQGRGRGTALSAIAGSAILRCLVIGLGLTSQANMQACNARSRLFWAYCTPSLLSQSRTSRLAQRVLLQPGCGAAVPRTGGTGDGGRDPGWARLGRA